MNRNEIKELKDKLRSVVRSISTTETTLMWELNKIRENRTMVNDIIRTLQAKCSHEFINEEDKGTCEVCGLFVDPIFD